MEISTGGKVAIGAGVLLIIGVGYWLYKKKHPTSVQDASAPIPSVAPSTPSATGGSSSATPVKPPTDMADVHAPSSTNPISKSATSTAKSTTLNTSSLKTSGGMAGTTAQDAAFTKREGTQGTSQDYKFDSRDNPTGHENDILDAIKYLKGR